MKISDKGLAIVKEFEGYEKALPDGRCQAYQSYLGNGKYDIPTIGWGCTEGVQMGMVWTREEAGEALRKEIGKFEEGVGKLVTFAPTQDQFDALVSFSYNVGLGNLAKSSVLKLANAGDFHGAAAAFAMWNKAQGVPLVGLTRRRHEEAALFLSSEPAKMPKAVDVPAEAPNSPVQAVSSRADPTTADEPAALPKAPTADLGDRIDKALTHAEAHKDLLASSWSYWANRISIKGIVGASAGSLAFAKDFAIVVCASALVAILVLEIVRYMQRSHAIGAKA
jgi:lysozyme